MHRKEIKAIHRTIRMQIRQTKKTQQNNKPCIQKYKKQQQPEFMFEVPLSLFVFLAKLILNPLFRSAEHFEL